MAGHRSRSGATGAGAGAVGAVTPTVDVPVPTPDGVPVIPWKSHGRFGDCPGRRRSPAALVDVYEQVEHIILTAGVYTRLAVRLGE